MIEWLASASWGSLLRVSLPVLSNSGAQFWWSLAVSEAPIVRPATPIPSRATLR